MNGVLMGQQQHLLESDGKNDNEKNDENNEKNEDNENNGEDNEEIICVTTVMSTMHQPTIMTGKYLSNYNK